MTRRVIYAVLVLLAIAPAIARASDADYQKTIDTFHKATESGQFFDNAFGYAVFPNIGKGGIGIGGAYGKGRVYQGGAWVGECSLKQATIGFQLGGQAYRQIIFFEDAKSFDQFTSGNFEFGAEASAVAVTAGASAKANTAGSSAGANVGTTDVTNVGRYHKGMATFTIAKGGLMYEASLGGQKFSYKKR
jgi:lipid-binding SYLF domain-containing protein